MPSNLFIGISLLRIYSYFHTVVEQTVRLRIIQYVELHFVISFGILDSEEKPLCVTLRVNIILHHQIVLAVANFLCKV